jgi:lysophospholipase L1-like esterase
VQRRPTLALAAAILVLLGPLGCSSAPEPDDARVLVIGDSLVNGTPETIAQGLSRAGWEPIIDARGGSSIGMWAATLEPVAEQAEARVAVVGLGTNDCAPDCEDVDQGISQIMSTLTESGVERVFWLNVQEGATYPESPTDVNARLELAAAKWTQLTVVDLNAALGGRPELHSDEVHFNEAGALALTALILEALGPAR